VALIKSISGIRGTIGGMPGEGLTPIDVLNFTAAYGMWVRMQSAPKKVVIGRDARISGPWIADITIHTLRNLGIEIIDLGLSTTPTVEFAVENESAGGGIIVTASHNPQNWNALKFLNSSGEFISEEAGKMILEISESQKFEFVPQNKIGTYSMIDDYIERHIAKILELPLVNVNAIRERNFRIAIDCVNSTGGIAIPKLLNALGVDRISAHNIDPTGHFPHNPEPVPENLAEICSEIEEGNYDLGIVVDPDVDRLALISENGDPFGEEYTLVAVADYILQNSKGNTVSNLSSTKALRDITEKHGCKYFPAAVGEVNVVKVMKEHHAVIGGEGNGGVIYPALHYGRDALVGIALFLTHLARFGKPASFLRSSYPNYAISKNKIELTPDINVDRILERIKKKYAKRPINSIDGVKIEFENEWVHLRKSNTEPIIRIISESDVLSKAEFLANKIIDDIKEIITEKEIE
jgi:phosphomannomutase